MEGWYVIDLTVQSYKLILLTNKLLLQNVAQKFLTKCIQMS